jgi:outer membrane protein OmpA-like peptidoglycan-associated protein
MAIGAGLGAGSGMITGANLDAAEGAELQQERDLAALKVQVGQNQRALMALQDSLDDRTRRINSMTTSEQVFFDNERASLHMGSAAALERLANAMKNNPFVTVIEIHGHADDQRTPADNMKLSEARARSVASFLSNQGISLSQMKIFAHGDTQLSVGDQTEPGRQLNRRVEVVARP